MAITAPKRKAQQPLRAEPQGPLGHLINDALIRLGRPSFDDAAKLIRDAAAADGEPNTSYNRFSIRNWIGRLVVPRSAKTLKWISQALDIPRADLAAAAAATEDYRCQQPPVALTTAAPSASSAISDRQPVLLDPSFNNPSLDGPADNGFVELIHRSIQQFVQLDNHYGADDIAGMVVRLFRSVTRRLANGLYQPAIERDLMAAAGELGELAGWLLFDADRQDAATQLNHEALYWATLSGDHAMVNFILSNVGLQAIHLQRPLEALHVAQRVRADESRLSPRVRALVHVREGRALALAGREHDAFRDFQQARAFFSDGVRGTDPQWTWWIDDFEITGHEGLCHRETGDSKTAVDLFHRAIETCPAGRARDRFMYQAQLLRTTADLQDWPEAIDVIDRLAPAMSEMASGRIASILRDATARICQDESAPTSLRDGAVHLDRLLAPAP